MDKLFKGAGERVERFNEEQRERYQSINYSLGQALLDKKFRQTLLETFGAKSLPEIANAAIWAIDNNVEFSQMITGYRQYLDQMNRE